jgi:hypothetical protein
MPPPVRPVRGTGQTGVGLGKGLLLVLLPIVTLFFSFFQSNFWPMLRRRDVGILHRIWL